ncbi:hypothetical protein K1T71_015234 [Dendrolimus kikuchii]|nr:hypothetical protein K1T71_015234 [Dendrolimus kikuchii]
MSDDREECLARLIRKRASLKGRITKLNQYVQSIENVRNFSTLQIKEIQRRQKICEELNSDFNHIQSQIEEECETNEEINTEAEEREGIEKQIIYIISFLEDLLEKTLPKDNDNKSITSVHSVHEHFSNSSQPIRLPEISLPLFDGSYLKWLEFRDTFESLIICNNSMPDINKFHYLRSSLRGGATEAMATLEFTSANFKVAWELLCKRYDNKQVLVNNHLKALFAIQPLHNESHKLLRYLVDQVSKNMRALSTLGQPTVHWDTLIIFMVTSKLDATTSIKWEEYKNNKTNIPTLEEFYEFIRNRANILESTRAIQGEKFSQNQNIKYNNFQTQTLQVKNNNKSNTNLSICSQDKIYEKLCLSCNEQGHLISECNKFLKLNIQDRFKEVQRLRLCSNCLREGHKTFHCRVKSLCKCKKKHNYLLHNEHQSLNSSEQVSLPLVSNSASDHTSTPSLSSSCNMISLSTTSIGQVLLSTALVKVINVNNEHTYLARALLDTGSQSSFITNRLKNKIMLSSDIIKPICISGITNMNFNIKEKCSVYIQSRTSTFNTHINCLIVPEITGTIPSVPVNIANLNIPTNLVFADPDFHQPSEIDILLGADVFWNIVGCERIVLGVGKPVLQKSELGWLISGPVGDGIPHQVTCHFTRQIHNDLQRFWEVEEVQFSKPIFSLEEKVCEEHFIQNFERLPNGRFSVKIPLKEIPENTLGDSFYLAKKRFLSLEKKLDKNPDLKRKYCEFIDEYLNLNHLSSVDKPEFGYYIPHHAVLHDKSETTKLRVVFDASAKTTSGKSFNDIQYIGPVVQDDLISILIRFRHYKYVLTADIQKMYRQIEIDSSQRHLQLILWRQNKCESIKVYKLNTVTYGTASAPFLSTRCLLQLAHECPDPIIGKVIAHDIYMDDFITSCQSEEDLRHIYDGVCSTLSSACFPIHKIRTNCPNVLQDETTSQALDLSKSTTVLGLNWSPLSDSLNFSVNLDLTNKITKRTIISLTCQIFDPLGLLCPCIIKAKIILQKLWVLKLTWDDEVPTQVAQDWKNIAEKLKCLTQVTVSRNVLCDFPISIELHCFVDASQEAYGACIYFRSTDNQGHIEVKLLCAKSRVSPLKILTIPRLELCGALLGAQLSQKVLDSVRCPIDRKVIWTDSTIVLGWIKAQPTLLKAFVANRVIMINELTQGFSWRHVPGDLNPADLASRGVDPLLLQAHPLWWEGPSFLRKDLSEWPQKLQNTAIDLPEFKLQVHVGSVDDCKDLSLVNFDQFSNYKRLLRMFAYVRRFIYNCRHKNNKLSGPLITEECNKALTSLIRFSQLESFKDEIQLLSNGASLCNKSNLLSLNPFLDHDGVLRVGGRMKNSPYNFNKKHPVILCGKNTFTKLLMRFEHNRLYHAGPQLLLASLREHYWPIGGRVLARATVKKCVICTRYRGKTIKPQMGNLPSVRTEGLFPFYSTGTDFAGPYQISSKRGRGNRTTKCYLCLFVCLSTRAVHIEVVSDLTSHAFILCLQRFISRRGKPRVIYCDNGTNFVGANNEFNKMLRSSRESTLNFASSEGIQFKFIPAYSPHCGGAWEAGVKSAKYHMKRVVGNASLCFEDLATLFIQIEAILNSRPLSPLSSDPADLNPLTPGHFLVGRPLMSVPFPAPELAKPNYQAIEKIRKEFWRRWRKEFLAELQQRSKWKLSTPEPCIGDMVIIKEENSPPQRWRLGRITKLHSGTDGITRVVDVYTAKGTIRRAIHNIVRLPAQEGF